MSERIYTLLLRFYPSSFRQAYGDDALQLLRDRARDERGFISGLRLWLDILSDLAVSILRAHRSAPAAARVRCHDGVPLFLSLEDEALDPDSLLYGATATVLIYGVVLLLAQHAGVPLPIQALGPAQLSHYSEAATGASSSTTAGAANCPGEIELPPPPAPTDGVAPPPSPDSDFFRSQISTIVEGQLGLKLKAGTGPVEMLVIDHVDQASEN
jgi:hypothetical protein